MCLINTLKSIFFFYILLSPWDRKCKFLPKDRRETEIRDQSFIEEAVLEMDLLTSVMNKMWNRKLRKQTTRTKISCLTAACSSFGNMSLTVAMKLSTAVNLGQKWIWLLPEGFVNRQTNRCYYLCINCQQNEHREETNSPELGQRHQSCRLRLSDEGQSWRPVMNCNVLLQIPPGWRGLQNWN